MFLRLSLFNLTKWVETLALFIIPLMLLTLLILVVAGCVSQNHAPSKLAYLAKSLFVAQCLERSTVIREVMGSNPVGDSDIYFCPILMATFHLYHLFNELQTYYLSFITSCSIWYIASAFCSAEILVWLVFLCTSKLLLRNLVSELQKNLSKLFENYFL